MSSKSTFYLFLVVLVATSVSGLAVQDLDSTTVEETINSGRWFVMFYAPWCQHCQQLEPIWKNFAEDVHQTTEINVARYDCTSGKDVCAKHGVRGYPTLLYFDEGFSLRYTGPRNQKSLNAFLAQASQPALTPLSSRPELSETIKENPVVLAYVTSNKSKRSAGKPEEEEEEEEDSMVDDVFHPLARQLVMDVKSVAVPRSVLEDELGQSSTVLVLFKDGEYEVYNGELNLKDMKDWADQNRFPRLMEFSQKPIIDLGTLKPDILLSMLAVDGPLQNAGNVGEEFKKAAYGEHELNEKVQFMWIDGKENINILNNAFHIKAEELPTIITWNGPKRSYWLYNNDSITQEKIMYFLEEIDNGNLEPTSGQGFVNNAIKFVSRSYSNLHSAFDALNAEHPTLAMLCVLSVTIFFVVTLRYLMSSFSSPKAIHNDRIEGNNEADDVDGETEEVEKSSISSKPKTEEEKKDD